MNLASDPQVRSRSNWGTLLKARRIDPSVANDLAAELEENKRPLGLSTTNTRARRSSGGGSSRTPVRRPPGGLPPPWCERSRAASVIGARRSPIPTRLSMRLLSSSKSRLGAAMRARGASADSAPAVRGLGLVFK